MAYVQVVKNETSTNVMELPLEDDFTMDLATITSQFPNAIGLKYKADSGAWRGLKVSGTKISHPGDAWSEDVKYVVTFADNKRKADEHEAEDRPKRSTNLKTSDLVVLNMPYDVTEDAMRSYFEKYGELSFWQLKKKSEGTSRGYGFIRFSELADQKKCLKDEHKMDDRTLEVKIPQSKAAGFEDSQKGVLSRRIHLGNVTSRITKKDLEEYFGQFGAITDIFVPKVTETRKNPMYAFLTYDDEDDARALVESKKSHTINGDTIDVAFASPINKDVVGPRKHPEDAFYDLVDKFIGDAFNGRLTEKPRSRHEAVGMACGLMKRWMRIYGGSTGGSYDDDRGRESRHLSNEYDRYRQELNSSGWAGITSAALTGYGLPGSYPTTNDYSAGATGATGANGGSRYDRR